MTNTKALSLIKPQWSVPSNIKAITTLRYGGVSKPPFNELNLALHVGDEVEAVSQNRKILQSALELPSEPVWLNQVHSTRVVDAGRTDTQRVVDADASITDQRGTVCAIMTADCLPLFLTNIQGTKVALVHAGWRGLADGIIENTVSEFSQPASEIIAWSGPCISQSHFEIGLEVKQSLGGSEGCYQLSNNNKYYADLCRLADERLQTIGVNKHSWNDHCTYRQIDHFYSFRREQQTGRMASLIWMD